MSTVKLSEAVKTRVSSNVKRALQRLADARQLQVSDIAREALRDFLNKPENRNGRTADV